MAAPVDSSRSDGQPSSFVLRPSSFVNGRSSVLGLALIAALTIAMWLLAWRVSADETVAIGTEADRIYITDGFYQPEKSAEHAFIAGHSLWAN